MGSAVKHQQRSKYSYHNYKPFADFTRRATVRMTGKAIRKESLLQKVKKLVYKQK